MVAGRGFEPPDLRVMSPTSYQAALPRDITTDGGAGDRSRTGTILSYHGILSPGRLPIPPHRQLIISVRAYYYITLYATCQPLISTFLKIFSTNLFKIGICAANNTQKPFSRQNTNKKAAVLSVALQKSFNFQNRVYPPLKSGNQHYFFFLRLYHLSP